MITTRTPLRISLAGGGTDMPSFYETHPGAVVSAAIDKYVYVSVNAKFDGRYRISYSRTENVSFPSEIKHDIVRETLKRFGLKGMEIVSISDIPGEGSGLGSSSAFTVGLINALGAYCGLRQQPQSLAENAFEIEAHACGHPVGKQDHYSAAYGGFRFYEFLKERVKSYDLELTSEEKQIVGSNLMLFWIGLRSQEGSTAILSDQGSRLAAGNGAETSGLAMAELAHRLRDDLCKKEFDRVGKFLHAGWTLKKKLSDKISNPWINEMVDNALRAGAEGAKVCGAGGGGFLLVNAPTLCHKSVEMALGLRRVPFWMGVPGSSVIYSGG